MITLAILMVFHFIGDFLLQTDHQATTKSFDIWSLSKHCLTYSIPFLLVGIKFALITGLLHFLIDFFTSKAASHYHKAGKRGLFFKVVGFDQLLHALCLIGCAELLLL